ncbi:hypothetical protein E2C01_084601 [Portunus trituberculatus]|uniref:Uncharacterized protein n=1 Tax=Portunus trituberculatus TaxID=210409 RepID=A0A5B7J866_PORTR|nr:hypothetical protein [Portunus trituberculatus]
MNRETTKIATTPPHAPGTKPPQHHHSEPEATPQTGSFVNSHHNTTARLLCKQPPQRARSNTTARFLCKYHHTTTTEPTSEASEPEPNHHHHSHIHL